MGYPYMSRLHPSNPQLLRYVLTGEAAYASAYYGLGFRATSRARPEAYSSFALIALCGALVQPLVATVAGWLSVVLMFHRLASYAHADACAAEFRVPHSLGPASQGRW